MQLLLLRHAKAAQCDFPLPDFERPLSEHGRQQAINIARWLKQTDLIPDRILVSAATRTQQTLQPWLDQHPDKHADIHESLYGATPGEILGLIDETPGSKLVLVVAHNPGLEYLLRYLSGTDQTMRPGDIAWLRQQPDESTWQAGQAELLAHISS